VYFPTKKLITPIGTKSIARVEQLLSVINFSTITVVSSKPRNVTIVVRLSCAEEPPLLSDSTH
jgi:hypothetical protein